MAFLAPTNGSNTAPSYSFNGDENTGMYQDGNGVLAFVSDSSEVFRIQGGALLSVGGANATYNQNAPLSPVSLAVASGKIMMSGNISTTVTDENIFAFYRRPGAATGTPLSSGENMGRIGWYGSNNDSDNSTEGASLGAVAYPATWISGANRIAAIVGKVAGTEKARLNWDGSLMVGGTLPSSPNASISSAGNLVLAGSVTSSGSAYFVQTGTTAVTKTLTTAGSTDSRRRSYLLFISNSFGEFGGNGSQRTYSLGIWTPGNTGGVWVEIAGKATDANTGNLSITASGGDELTITKSAGVSGTNTGFVIQLLDSAEGLISIS